VVGVSDRPRPGAPMSGETIRVAQAQRLAMLDAAELMAYWPRMVGYARRFLIEADPSEWEDAAAAALEDALRRPASLEATGSVEGWLIQATRWRALSLRDKRRRELGHHAELPDHRAHGARLDAGSSAHVTALMVRDALAGLPEKLRRHAASRMEGRSLREVAKALGHTKETAYHHEVALKAAMRLRLAGESVPSTVTLRPKPQPSGKQCSEDDCAGSVVARGLCRKHYLRTWRSAQAEAAS
jgi:RNA polymerase sigma factor (sigma-70 family)